jgi:hypothetical protein
MALRKTTEYGQHMVRDLTVPMFKVDMMIVFLKLIALI